MARMLNDNDQNTSGTTEKRLIRESLGSPDGKGKEPIPSIHAISLEDNLKSDKMMPAYGNGTQKSTRVIAKAKFLYYFHGKNWNFLKIQRNFKK